MKKLFVYLFMALCMGNMLCSAQTKKPAAKSSARTTSSKSTTSKPKPVAHTAVDLGLPSGTLWATCNVGATIPEEFGNLYSWGETQTKKSFYESKYTLYIPPKFKESGGGKDKDGFDVPYKREKISDGGMVDVGKNIAGTQYDVARKLWGEEWQMPTKAQLDELYIACSWEVVKKNDVWGAKVTGPNGNWIFLPCAGWSDRDDYRVGLGVRGSYWTSTTNGMMSTHSKAYYWSFAEGSVAQMILGEEPGYYGCTVRPVKSTMKQPVAPHIESNRIDIIITDDLQRGHFKKEGTPNKAVPQQADMLRTQLFAYGDSIMKLCEGKNLGSLQKAEEILTKMVALKANQYAAYLASCYTRVANCYLQYARDMISLGLGVEVDVATIDEAIRISNHVVGMCSSTTATNISKNTRKEDFDIERVLERANSQIQRLESRKQRQLERSKSTE